jgi:tryptophan synthase beta chain
MPTQPDATGHFGPYGGSFVPETLIHALEELTSEYARARADAPTRCRAPGSAPE